MNGTGSCLRAKCRTSTALLSALVIAGAAIPATGWAGTWHDQLIENSGVPGIYHSLAVDGAGRPHLAYTRSSSAIFRYATLSGGVWKYVKIANDTDWGHVRAHTISIAVTAGGKPHVAFFDNATSRIKYAVYNNGAWASQVIDGSATIVCGEHNAIALDSKNRPHILYTVFNNNTFASEMRYASWNGTSWTISVASTGHAKEWIEDGAEVALAIDAGGQAHAAYICVDERVVIGGYYPKIVRYAASSDGVNWGWRDIDYTTANYYYGARLQLDDADNPHVAAILYKPGGFGDLRYARYSSGGWSATATIATGVSSFLGFMVRGDGMPVAAYGNSNYRLMFGGRVGALWRAQQLKSTGTTGSGDCRLARGPDGRAFLSYYFINTQLNRAEFRLAQSAPGLWPGVTLATALDKNATWQTSAATPWLGQASVAHDGLDAARPDYLGHNAASWLSTAVTGPATISFWWKTSSEAGDKLTFYVDGGAKSALGGMVGWQKKSFAIGSGSHVVKWEFKRNASGSAGLNTGFLDQVAIVK